MKFVSGDRKSIQWLRILLKYHTQRVKKGANREQLLKIAKFLGPNSVFFDIGANKGLFSYWASRSIVGTGTIHIFEPQPELFWIFNKLETRFPNHKFYLNNFGLSDKNTNALLNRNCIGDGSASVQPLSEKDSHLEAITLQTLDQYCQSFQIDKIDFIKIDVEGHESKTIAGGIETIRKFKPTLLVEMSPGKESKTILDNFIDLGYYVKMIYYGKTYDQDSRLFEKFFSSKDSQLNHADFLFIQA